DARTELERLASLPRRHPLVDQLRAFVEASAKAPVDVGTLPNAPTAKPTEPKPAAPQTTPSRPTAASGRGAHHTEDGRVADDYVVPGSAADTSDLPVPKPSAAPSAAPVAPSSAPDAPK